MIVGIGNKQMHAAAEGDPGPLKDATFYKNLGNNLIGASCAKTATLGFS